MTETIDTGGMPAAPPAGPQTRAERRRQMRGMGRVFPRGSVWWVAYYHRGKEYREPAYEADSDNRRRSSESIARKLLKKRLGEIGNGKLIGPTEERVTFEQMAEDLLKDYEINAKRSVRSIKLSIEHLKRFFGLDRALDITTDRVRLYISQRQEEITRQQQTLLSRKLEQCRQLREKAKTLEEAEKAETLAELNWLEAKVKRLQRISNASINRELSALKRMFALMVQAGKLSSKPYIPMLEENNARQGFLDYGSFLLLREALPDYLRDPIGFLYFSGWRLSEMRLLEWRDVDLAGKVIRLRPEISKNKDGRLLPLQGELLGIIERAKAGRRLDCLRVFHLDGQPIGDFRKAWKAACKAVGLSGLIVHDLRRSAVRNMVRAGIREGVAMALSGHKTRSVFDRYNIVDEADLAKAATQLQAHLQEQPKAPVVVPVIITPAKAAR